MKDEDVARPTAPAAAEGGRAETRAERIARVHYTEDGRRRWPFEGVATLLGAALDERAAKAPERAALDVALLGVPFDLGVTNRPGARLGPRALRAVERIGPHEPVLDLVPLAEARVADIGDIPLPTRYSLERCHEAIEAFVARLAAAGIRPLVAGGDHSITGPILRALGRGRPLGLIQIDAHADTAGPYEGTAGHHGAPFREAALAGVLDPRRTVQIGIRGGVTWLWEYSAQSGMTVIPMHEVDALGIPGVVAKARAVVGEGPCYLSFDIDSLDPAFAPGTGTPEAGGLTTREAIALLRGLAGLDIVAGDVVEVAPQYDPTTVTAQAAAQMLFQVLCLMVRAPSFRSRA